MHPRAIARGTAHPSAPVRAVGARRGGTSRGRVARGPVLFIHQPECHTCAARSLSRLPQLAGLLQQQGKSLEKFRETGVADHGKKYEAARQEAWNELKELLDLDPKVVTAPEPKPAGKKP